MPAHERVMPISNPRWLASVRWRDRALAAALFGALAALPALPWSVSRYLSIKEWDGQGAILVLILEGFLPIIMAAFYGARIGGRALAQGESLPRVKALLIGISIALKSAVGWFISALIIVMAMSPFVDTRRMLGGVPILAIVGFPIYGSLAALGGLGLRFLALKTRRANDAREQ